MLINRFEELKNLIDKNIENGVIEGEDVLNIKEMEADIEEFIEEYELFYRINQLKGYLDMLEREVYTLIK